MKCDHNFSASKDIKKIAVFRSAIKIKLIDDKIVSNFVHCSHMTDTKWLAE